MCGPHYRRNRTYGDPLAGRAHNGVPQQHYFENLMSVVEGHKLWPFLLSPQGYGRVYLSGQMVVVSAQACAAWHGQRPPGMQAAHGEGCPRHCWNGAHMSWKTAKENADDQLRDGTRRSGAGVSTTKLTAQEVLTIRDRLAHGERRQSLSNEFGVHYCTIQLIDQGKTWRHLLPVQEE